MVFWNGIAVPFIVLILVYKCNRLHGVVQRCMPISDELMQPRPHFYPIRIGLEVSQGNTSKNVFALEVCNLPFRHMQWMKEKF